MGSWMGLRTSGNSGMRHWTVICSRSRRLILRSAVAEARTIMDAAGNTKLTKSGHGRRRSARDDAVAAAIIAVAVARRVANRPAAGPPMMARV